MRATGLERNVKGRPWTWFSAQISQGVNLGMGLARGGMVTFRDDLAGFHDERSHHWIRVRLPPALSGRGQRAAHKVILTFEINHTGRFAALSGT